MITQLQFVLSAVNWEGWINGALIGGLIGGGIGIVLKLCLSGPGRQA